MSAGDAATGSPAAEPGAVSPGRSVVMTAEATSAHLPGRDRHGRGRRGEAEVPRDPVEAGIGGIRGGQRHHVRTEQDRDAPPAQARHRVLEGWVRGHRPVGERQRHDRKALAVRLDEQSEHECVGDAGRPLVDGVDRGRGDHQRIRGREHVGLVGMLVAAPHRVSGLCREAIGVDELAAVRRGHHADVPPVPLGEVDEPPTRRAAGEPHART